MLFQNNLQILYWTRKTLCSRFYGICSSTVLDNLCKYLNLNKCEGESLLKKYPSIQKFDDKRIETLKHTLCHLGFPKDILVKEPKLFNISPVKIRYRYTLLRECGLPTVSSKHIILFFKIFRHKTIGQLKDVDIMPQSLNVENQLISNMTNCLRPSCTKAHGDINQYTLYTLRIEILKRFLKLNVQLSGDELQRGLESNLRFQPLQAVDKMLFLLQKEITMPMEIIKSNLFLLHGKPDNLEQIINNIPCIGDINIKEIITKCPALAMKRYSDVMETVNLLDEYGISPKVGSSFYRLFTLNPNTIRERIEHAKEIPELNIYYKDPRFLKIILYYNKALKRVDELYKNKKKCISLNYLTDKAAAYETFKQSQHDRLQRRKDLLLIFKQVLDEESSCYIYNKLKKHPLWMNVSAIQVKYVYDKLIDLFSENDICENCEILLYPWNMIDETMNLLDVSPKKLNNEVDVESIRQSQKLSLVLNLLKNNTRNESDVIQSQKSNVHEY